MMDFKKSFLVILLLATACSSLQKNQQRATLYWQIGVDYLERGAYPDALVNLEEADKLDPNNPEILNSLGMLYFRREKYDVSISYLDRALKINPKYTDARNNYSRVLIALAQYDQAIRQLQIVLKDLTYEQQEKAYTNLGLAFLRQEKYKRAKPQFVKALKINRNFCPAYNFYGQTLMKLNEFQTASSIFDQAIKMCENNTEELNYFSAITDYQLGRKNQARFHLQQIIKNNPASEYAEKAQKLLATMDQGQQ